MGNRGRVTFAKRQREIARQERAREKSAKRVERKATKVKVERGADDDPDIAGIVPGPQPLPYELTEEDLREEEAEDAEEAEEEEKEEKEEPR
jgi:hypothetical protein